MQFRKPKQAAQKRPLTPERAKRLREEIEQATDAALKAIKARGSRKPKPKPPRWRFWLR
jgi:hypothetical protein